MEIMYIEAQTFEALMQGFEEFVRKVDQLCERHLGKELNEWLDN